MEDKKKTILHLQLWIHRMPDNYTYLIKRTGLQNNPFSFSWSLHNNEHLLWLLF